MNEKLDKENLGLSAVNGMTDEIVCLRFSNEEWVKAPLQVPSEMELTLYINQKELVTILCTPNKLNHLVLGFLYGEGIISSLNDVMVLRMCQEEAVADVRISDSQFKLPTLRTITSGCGGGSVFKTQGKRVDSQLIVKPTEVLSLMKQLLDKMELYRISGGVHTSALADSQNLLIVAEDIGRHNTLDKIQGECLMRGLKTKDLLILCTGRVSSEMLLKAAKMQVPIVVSRHSPTGRAVSLAGELGITLIGHARGDRLLVYSHPERLGCSTN